MDKLHAWKILNNIDDKPNYISPEGNKWYVSKQLTKKARGVGKNIVCWVVEWKSGQVTFIITQDNKIIFQDVKSEEGIWTHLEIMNMGRNWSL